MVPRWGAGLALLSAIHREGWEIRGGHLCPPTLHDKWEWACIYAFTVCSPASSPVGIALLGCPGEVQDLFSQVLQQVRRWASSLDLRATSPTYKWWGGSKEKISPLCSHHMADERATLWSTWKNLEHNIKYLDTENVTLRFFKSLCNTLRDSRICCCSSNHCCSL